MARYKANTDIVTGIDIGSTSIRVAVGKLEEQMGGKQQMQIIGAIEVPSEGVIKGVVSSIDETVSSLSRALEEAERAIGMPIDHAWIGISGSQVIAQKNKGVVAVAKPDGDITEEDVERAVDAARTIAPPLNYEILHALPSSYVVDGQTGITDPVGMTGVRLEVDAQIIYVNSAHIKHITKAVYRTGIDIDDIILSILATADIVVTPKQKELGVAVVNIGGPTTSIVVYEGGDVIHTATLPIGAEHITNDIAIGLRTSIDIAERVKLEYGSCAPGTISKKEKIDLASMGQTNSEMVQLHYIAEIIEARAAEILSKVEKELRSIQRNGLLPAGVVITGGGAQLPSIVELAKEVIQLPASIGYPLNIDSITDKVHDLSFSTVIGLVAWGARAELGKVRQHTSRFTSTGKTIEKIQGIWKSLIP